MPHGDLIHMIHADSQTVNQRPDLRKRPRDSKPAKPVNQPLTCTNTPNHPQRAVNQHTARKPLTCTNTDLDSVIHESPLRGCAPAGAHPGACMRVLARTRARQRQVEQLHRAPSNAFTAPKGIAA